MEQWQIEAITQLLQAEVKEVEEGNRVYTSSATYGDSRYHLLNKRYDGIQIEQVNIDEKWGSRVNLYGDELPAVLKTLLGWYLADVKQEQERKAVPSDDLGDLDEHPF